MSEQSRVLPPPAADATGGEFKGILSTTEERVSEILVATERAAAAIVEAANVEAEQIVRATHARAENLAQSRLERIDSVAEAVLAKASALEGEIDGLRDLIYRSIETLAEELGLAALAEELGIAAHTSEPATPPAAEQSWPSSNESRLSDGMRSSAKRDRSDAVRLLATQMMAAGHTKEETARRLTEEFGVKDPTVALSSIGINAGTQR